MTDVDRSRALTKLAYFGSAAVQGSPSFFPAPLTVGQVMHDISNPFSPMSRPMARSLTDRIVNSGVDVNSPAKKLLHAGIGALAGNFISNMLGAGPFARGVATTLGARYGYNH